MDPNVDWQKLTGALRELHRVLLERARGDYEQAHGASLQPGEFLQMLTTRAEFAWLRELSELIVDLDLVRDSGATHQDAITDAVRAAVEYVIAPSNPASTFSQRYWPYVHADPHVAMAHGSVRQALVAWPAPAQDDAATRLHERHRVAAKARHLSQRTKK